MAAEGISEFSFDVEADRKLDQRLSGERFPSGQGEDPNNPQSLTTDIPTDPEARANAAQELAVEEAAPQSDPAEVARLKKIVGDQGNELGELRRQTAAQEALQARIAQLEAERQQAQAPAQGEFDMFAGIPDDQRYMSPLERKQISQAYQQLAMAAQAEIQRARDEAQYFAAKTASGVDAGMEAELVREHPFLNSLTGVQKAEAIAQMARYRKGAQDAPAQAANEAARASARANTVESSVGTGGSADTTLEPAIEKLAREARAGRYNSEELRERLAKLGVPRYDSNGLRY